MAISEEVLRGIEWTKLWQIKKSKENKYLLITLIQS